MENEKIELKDRLLAGVAYLGLLLAVIIGIFYWNKKNIRGFVSYHSIQAMILNIALNVIGFVVGILIFSFGLATPESVKSGFPEWLNWVWWLLLAAFFVLAASGWRFRIPIICNITDWYLNHVDGLYKKAEETKDKKV